MLILARYIDEAVLIGSCRVTVLGVVRRKGRARIKLGIDAPPDTQILRAELPRHPSPAQSHAHSPHESQHAGLRGAPADVREEAGA
jgi:carbon storage regulator CsrA